MTKILTVEFTSKTFFKTYLDQVTQELRTCATPLLSSDGKKCTILFDDAKMKKALKNFAITYGTVTDKEFGIFPPLSK